jgi:hypothetical protein
VGGKRQAALGGIASWASTGGFHIGRAITGSQFTGALDDVRAYAAALTDAQVAAL